MTGKAIFAALTALLVSVAVADDVLILDEEGRGTTGRFRVLDHEGEALGLMVSAEDKFIAAASTARMAVDPSWIRVTIDCPVPMGMAAEKLTSNAWAGDGVELFIRPSLDSSAYYQYSANAAGVFAARCNTASDVMDGEWKSAAAAEAEDTANGFRVMFSVPLSEVFRTPLKPGDVFGINFTRCGKTCNGLSTWAAVGDRFSNVEAFGKAIYGGAKAYFERKLEAMRKKGDRMLPTAVRPESAPCRLQDRKTVEKIRELTVAVEERGDDLAQFAAIEKLFADVEKAIVSDALAGKPLLLFRPEAPWGNLLAPNEKSRPLGSLRIRTARNSRAVVTFAAANLTDSAFVGQFKVEADDAITRRISLFQGFAIANRAGRTLYDPIQPLPMNGLLRLAPKETAPIYLELDTHGLVAGACRATLSLKKATPGFTDETIALEIQVADANLDEIVVDRAGYDYVGNTFARGDGAKNVVKLLVDRGYNVVFMTASWIFPCERKDGSFAVKDFGYVDRHLDAVLAGGLPRDRMKLWVYMAMEAQHPWNAPLNVRGQRCAPGDGKWEKGV